jgi:hypothetical protein
LYPNLSIIAFDILLIFAMLAKPERLVSSTKITITDYKNCLGIKSIKAIKCLKLWLSKGNIVAYTNNTIDIKLLM